MMREVKVDQRKEVAAKRHDHKWAEELVVFKISNGSVGEYGTVEMTHNNVREEDARVLAKWILSLWSSNPQASSNEDKFNSM